MHVADLDGDGKLDLFFEGPKGEKVAWLMDGVRQAGMRYLTGVDALVHVTDMNGDGVPDVASNHAIHLMGSVDVVASIWLAPSFDRRITHVGDFNGDGKVDFAWRNPSTGTTSIMLLNGLNVVVDQSVLTSHDWRVTTVADFDGDGKSDLLRRNAATGEIAMWKMDGTFYAGGAVLLAQRDWQVHKVGNFDGNVGSAGKPKSDLLYARYGERPARDLADGWLSLCRRRNRARRHPLVGDAVAVGHRNPWRMGWDSSFTLRGYRLQNVQGCPRCCPQRAIGGPTRTVV